MKNKRLSDYRGYEGIDADLETSLYEYGLIWKKFTRGNHKGYYHFIYGVGYGLPDNSGNHEAQYNLFDWGDIAIDIDPKTEWSWISEKEWKQVAETSGMTVRDFLAMSLPQIVSDLISYYGYENVFGSSYYPFEIHKRG